MIKFLRLLANVVGIVLPIISSVTTYRGLAMANRLAETEFARETVPLIVSVAVCLLSASFALFFINLYPLTETEEKTRKKLNRLLAVVFAFTLIGQTYWSVISIGGIPAITYHLSTMVEKGYEKLGEISASVEDVSTLKHGIDTQKEQFAMLGRMEELRGVFSNHKGAGNVFLQIQVVERSLENTSSAISKAYEGKTALIGDCRKKLQEMQQILDNSETNIGYKMSQFGTRLSQLNHLFQKIQSLDISQVVSVMNDQLLELSSIAPPQGNSRLEQDQREAIGKLRTHVESAQEMVNELSSKSQYSSSRIRLEQLSTISVSFATLWYCWRIPGEIAISVAIDIGPYVLVFFLFYMNAILRVRENEQRGTIHMES